MSYTISAYVADLLSRPAPKLSPLGQARLAEAVLAIKLAYGQS